MSDDKSTLRVTATAPGAADARPGGGGSGGQRRRPSRMPRWLRLSRRVRSSIGLRLVVLALALGLPFMLYVGVNALRQASAERDEAKQRTLSLARLFAARVDDYVGDMVSALALVGHGASIDPASTVANDAFLHRIRPDLPRSINNAGVWTLDGHNVGAIDRATMRSDYGIADLAFFETAVRTRKLAIAGPLVSRANGEEVVVFARPVIGDTGQVTGIITVSARLRDLQWLLDLKGAAPRGTVVSLVNADGVVLTRNIEPERWIGKSVLGVGRAREHIEDGEGVDETLGADNVPRIAGYTRATLAPWHVFVGMPAEAALSAARANLAQTLAFGTAALLLGAGLAAWIGARIARPLHRLAYDATLLARGNLAHRTSVAGDDETGVLASTLNRLAQTVEERTRALQEQTSALEEKTAALERSTTELATITANVPVLIAYIDADEHFRFVNDYFRHGFGLPPDEVLGRTLRDVVGDEVYARLEGRLQDVRAGLPQTFEASFSPSGRAPIFIVSCFPDYGERQEVRGAYVVCQDITRRKEAEEALAARERFVRLIADGIPARITYIDRNERLLFGNRRFVEYWGREAGDVVGRRIDEIVTPAAYAQIRPELHRSFAGEPRHFDLVVERPEGTNHYQVHHVPDVDATGAVQGVVTISQDVTPLKEVERQLERLAQNDALTGLPNRHMFNDGIAAALRRSQRTASQVALLFLDIDGFKMINDTLGHAAGDDVLREFARRLVACVRATDLVARLAGDEFVIVLEGIHTREECRFVARKIIAAMREEFRAGDATAKVTTSIGIALGQGGATTPEALLKRADSALYAAKGRGRDRFEIAI